MCVCVCVGGWPKQTVLTQICTHYLICQLRLATDMLHICSHTKAQKSHTHTHGRPIHSTFYLHRAHGLTHPPVRLANNLLPVKPKHRAKKSKGTNALTLNTQMQSPGAYALLLDSLRKKQGMRENDFHKAAHIDIYTYIYIHMYTYTLCLHIHTDLYMYTYRNREMCQYSAHACRVSALVAHV